MSRGGTPVVMQNRWSCIWSLAGPVDIFAFGGADVICIKNCWSVEKKSCVINSLHTRVSQFKLLWRHAASVCPKGPDTWQSSPIPQMESNSSILLVRSLCVVDFRVYLKKNTFCLVLQNPILGGASIDIPPSLQPVYLIPVSLSPHAQSTSYLQITIRLDIYRN